MTTSYFVKVNGWTRPEAGTYVHRSTGIEVVRIDGHGPAHWIIRVPTKGSVGWKIYRNRFWTRDAAAPQAESIVTAYQAMIASAYADADTMRGDMQATNLANRAYTHPAYDAARPTKSHEASMLAGQRAVIDDDHEAAIHEHRSRWGHLPRTDDPATLAVRVDDIRHWFRYGRLTLDTAIRDLRRETGVTLAGAAAILDADPTVPINELADQLAPA